MTNSLDVAAFVGFCIFTWVLYLYRKGRLKEDHALLWLFVSLGIVLLSTWTNLLLAINWFMGAEKASDVVLASFIAFLLIVCIYFSVRISDLAEQNKKTAQDLASMKVEEKAICGKQKANPD